MRQLPLLIVAAILCRDAQASPVLDSPSCGAFTLEPAGLRFYPWEAAKGWTMGGRLYDGTMPEEDGSRRFFIGRKIAWNKAETNFFGRVLFSPRADGAADVAYAFGSPSDRELSELSVRAELPKDRYDKSALVVREGTQDAATELTLADTEGKTLRFRFASPTVVVWQYPSVRFVATRKSPFRRGETASLKFTVATDAPIRVRPQKKVVMREGPDWVPVRFSQDVLPGSALDFSELVPTHAPAGKFGRLRRVGEHFEFAGRPGAPVRFWGVNFGFAVSMLPYASAKELARRLRRIGYNAVRIHVYDGWLGLTYQSRGERIHPGRLRLMDETCAALIEEGIYLTTDLYCNRPDLLYRDVGVDRDGKVGSTEYKALAMVHEGTFNELKGFVRGWLAHRNPLTGRTYAEEPALATIAFLNETNWATTDAGVLGKIPEWRAAWKDWLARHRAEPGYADIPDAFPTDLRPSTPRTAAFSRFASDVEQDFFRRMRTFLREELKCGALFSEFSGGPCPVAVQEARWNNHDYADTHYYIDHPEVLSGILIGSDYTVRCRNANPLKEPDAGTCERAPLRRVLGMPISIGEFNYCVPGSYRMAGGLLSGALAACQDWDAAYRFCWEHWQGPATNAAAAAMNPFSVATDPIGLMAERTAVALFRRGDLAPLSETFEVCVPTAAKCPLTGPVYNEAPWAEFAWYRRMGTRIADRVPSDPKRGGWYCVLYPLSRDAFFARQGPLGAPGDGRLAYDRQAGTFSVATARTCAILAEDGRVDAGALSVDVHGVPATVSAIVLTGESFAAARRILVTHLTDCRAEGMSFTDDTGTVLCSVGGPRRLFRNGRATVCLRVPQGTWTVFALGMDGRRRSAVPSRLADDGRLSFEADVGRTRDEATFAYELVKR